MRIIILLSILIFEFNLLFTKDLYFPPVEGSEWVSVSPESFGWCTEEIDTCLHYLADAGNRWAYHNAPYTLLESVM